MTEKANRRGLVRLEYNQLVEQAASRAFKDHHATRRASSSIQHLFDGDYIGRVDFGATFGFEVLVRCECSGDDSLKPLAARRHEGIVMREAHGDAEATGFEVQGSLIDALALTGVKSESVQKSVNPISLLARDFFPQMLQGNTLPQSNWPALARNLKLWETNFGINIDMMRLMMEEFGQHPEWCRRSRRPPWRVFLSRRDELATLVITRRRRDPANRKYSAGKGPEYWFGHHVPRAYAQA
jgi:hypothetical protein